MEEAGVGSATSDTSMQIGGALGVAVLGTALNIRFHDAVDPLLARHPVPPKVASFIEGSLGGALAVADRLPARLGEPLAATARHGFVRGMDLGLAIAALVVAAAALVVLALLPSRAGPTVPPSAGGEPAREAPGGRNAPSARAQAAGESRSTSSGRKRATNSMAR